MEEFNILICDDDHSIVDAIEIYLKQDGYRVIKAYNGLEALKAFKRRPDDGASTGKLYYHRSTGAFCP